MCFPASGLALFMKVGQIQLACGLAPHLINVLNREPPNSPCQYLISRATDNISRGHSTVAFLCSSHPVPGTDILAAVAGSYFPT